MECCSFSVQNGQFEFSLLAEFTYYYYLNKFIYLRLAVLCVSRCVGFCLVAERCVCGW